MSEDQYTHANAKTIYENSFPEHFSQCDSSDLYNNSNKNEIHILS